MKKSELFFSALRVPVDFIMVLVAGFLAYFLRLSDLIQGFKPLSEEQAGQFLFLPYSRLMVIVAFFAVLVFAIEGLYAIRSTRKPLAEIYRVFRAILLVTMLLAVSIFLNPDWFASRFIILTGAFLSFLLVTFSRLLLILIQNQLLKRKQLGVHRVLLIGVGRFCRELKEGIEDNRVRGYKLIGHIKDVDFKQIERIKKMRGIDEIIQASSDISRDDLFKLKDFCMRNKIIFQYLPTRLQTANFEVKFILGEPVIEIKNTPLDGWGKIIKRIFDLVGAVVGIVLFSPLMAVSALLIFLESGLPVIFRNERVGHKQEFDLFKFRYMKKKYCHGKQFPKEHNQKALAYLDKLIEKQSIKKGPLYKIKDDPRKTKVGYYLEKLSLDEIPQLFNVLKGEMSLVGPRPHQPIEVEKYEDYQKRVLTIKPGITGIAQVSGRSDLTFEDEVRLDTFYIENWSLWGDVKIILKTFPSLLRRRGN